MKAQHSAPAFHPAAGLAAVLLSFVLLVNPVRAQSAADTSGPTAAPLVATDEAVVAELNKLGQFFDVNRQIEDAVRENVDKLEDATFLKQHGQLAEHLKKHPRAATALRAEKRFFLYRELARWAKKPLLRADVVQFDAFLEKHPAVDGPLARKPALLWDGTFMAAHPELAAFLDAHPGLSTVLLGKARRASSSP